MAKIDTLNDIGSLANTTSARAEINSNFAKITEAMQNTLSLDGSQPNEMEADIDLNSHYLLNVADPVNDMDGVNKRSVETLVGGFVTEIIESAILGALQVVVVDPAAVGQDTITLPSSPGTVYNAEVFVDGVALYPPMDFTLTGAANNIIALTTPLAGGEKVMVRYSEALASGLPDDPALRPDLLSTSAGKGAELVRVLQDGTGAVATTVADELKRNFYVEQFGAVGDGVTEDTAAINATIDAAFAAGGGVVNLGAKQYLVGALVPKAGVVLRGAGMGATELLQTGTPDYVVKSQGTLDTAVALTSDALIGATTLQLTSTATLAAGDYLILSQADDYNPAGAGYDSGEMVQVFTVDSGVQVTLYAPVKGSMGAAGTYLTAETASVRKINMVNAPGIESLTITGDQATNAGLLAFKYCERPTVTNVALRNGGHYGLRLDTVHDAVVTGLIVNDLLDSLPTHVGYGIVLAGANDGVIISDSHFTRVRHGITTIGGPDGFTHRVVVNGCTAHATTAAGFDTHAAGDGIVFHGCQVYGSQGQGFSIRSINTEVANCTVSRCVNHGIAATETLVRNLAVRDCTVEYSDQHGFNATDAVAGLILSGNVFRAPGNDGIRLSSMSTFVQILDNYVIGAGRTGSNRWGITSIASGANAGRWMVARNFVRADSGSVANAIALPNVNTSYVVDNKAFGTFGSGAYSLGSNVDLRNDVVDAMFLTPTTLAASANNYAPTGHGSTSRMRIGASTPVNITGLAGGADGRMMTLFNISANTITLSHESASSTDVNRFLCPGSVGFAITANSSVTLIYDGTSLRWRVVSN